MEPGTKFQGISHVVILVVYDASSNGIAVIQLDIRSVMNLESLLLRTSMSTCHLYQSSSPIHQHM